VFRPKSSTRDGASCTGSRANNPVMACRSIIRFAEGMTLDDYLADEKTRHAVMRGYEILGEAVRHIPEQLKQVTSVPDRSAGRQSTVMLPTMPSQSWSAQTSS
jgi:hypothetical protein